MTERQKDRMTERQKDRMTERQKDRKTKKHKGIVTNANAQEHITQEIKSNSFYH